MGVLEEKEEKKEQEEETGIRGEGKKGHLD